MIRIKTPLLICLSWFLVQSNLFAVGKKGKDIIVTRSDGSEVTGELIAVRPDALLLLEKISSRDLLIQIVDIDAIKVIRRAKPLKGTLIGLASAAFIGGVYGYYNPGDAELDSYYWKFGAVTAAPFGIVIGFMTSIIIAHDSTYQFKDKPQSFKDEVLIKLRKHARIKDAY